MQLTEADRFLEILVDYLRRSDEGECIDRSAFLAQHADFAVQLQAYFDGAEIVEAMAGRQVGAVRNPLPRNTPPRGGEGEDMPEEDMPEKEATHTESAASTSGSLVRSEGKQARIRKSFGRYRIRKVLGQGAMGIVYLAHDTQLDRQVALKIPKFSGEDSDDALARFYREARSAAALRHANICPVFDVGQIEGQHYIAMAFIEGRPLRDFIHRGKPQPERQSAAIIRKLALGLAEAHAAGVIHRDLKPANIIIDRRGEPVIMDFGLARRTMGNEAHVTHSGAIIGTPAYMSPEQVEGDSQQVGPAADIYSLGVIFYELLAGKLPFDGGLMAVLKQITTREPDLPSRWRPGCSPRLEAICLKMMSKSVEGRHGSMEDVAEALADYLRTFARGGDQPLAADTDVRQSNATTAIDERPSPPCPMVNSSNQVPVTPGFHEGISMDSSEGPLADSRVSASAAMAAPPVANVPPEFQPPESLAPEFQAAVAVEENSVGGEVGPRGARVNPAVSRGASESRHPRDSRRIRRAVMALGGAAAVLFLGIVLFFPTAQGTLRVEIASDDVEVHVKGTTFVLTGADVQPIQLDPGEKTLVVKRGDFTFETRSLTLKRGETVTAKVEWLDGEIQVLANGSNIGSGKPIEATSPPPGLLAQGHEPGITATTTQPDAASGATNPSPARPAASEKSSTAPYRETAEYRQFLPGTWYDVDPKSLVPRDPSTLKLVGNAWEYSEHPNWKSPLTAEHITGADYAIRVRVEALVSSGNEMCIGLRKSASNSGYTLGINWGARQFWGGLDRATGWNHLGSQDAPGWAGWGGDAKDVIELTALARGNTLYVFANGDRVAEFKNNTYQAPGSFWLNSRVQCRFRDVQVQYLDQVPVVYAPLPLAFGEAEIVISGFPRPFVVQELDGQFEIEPTSGVSPAILRVRSKPARSTYYSFQIHFLDYQTSVPVRGWLHGAPWDVQYHALPKDALLPEHVSAVAKQNSNAAEKMNHFKRNWTLDSLPPNLPPGPFAVVAQSESELPEGWYRVRVGAGRSVRVKLDDKVLLDNWNEPSIERTLAFTHVAAGKHRWQVESFQPGPQQSLTVQVEPLPRGRPVPNPLTAEAQADRAAAEWTLSLGGQVTIADEAGKERRIGSVDELPLEFRLLAINFFVMSAQTSELDDAMLEGLANLRSVNSLNLRGTPIGDAGVEKLSGMPSLKLLYLHATRISDDALAHIAKLSTLEHLDIGYNFKITDAGLARLTALPNISGINLFATGITDAALDHLAQVKTFRYIELKNGNLSAAAIEKLQGALPEAKIAK